MRTARGMGWGLFVVAGMAAAGLMLFAGRADVPSAWSAPAARSAPAASALDAAEARRQLPPPGAAAGVPPGIAAAPWQALERELAGRPAELARIAAYLAYADMLRRFKALPPGDERTALAAALERDLPDRLARREVSAGEARQIETAALQALEPDEAARAERLAEWQRSIEPPTAAPDARDAAFKRDQQALVAAWQARPPAVRDGPALAAQLEALRREHYTTPAPR